MNSYCTTIGKTVDVRRHRFSGAYHIDDCIHRQTDRQTDRKGDGEEEKERDGHVTKSGTGNYWYSVLTWRTDGDSERVFDRTETVDGRALEKPGVRRVDVPHYEDAVL